MTSFAVNLTIPVRVVTILLRSIFGVVLAGGLVLWCGIPFPAGVMIIASIGIMAALWGDKFLLWFMSLMRHLR